LGCIFPLLTSYIITNTPEEEEREEDDDEEEEGGGEGEEEEIGDGGVGHQMKTHSQKL